MKKINNKIDVSVIVPMYNVENLIAETIEYLKLTNCSLEVILINDGSSDATQNKAKDAIAGDNRFHIFAQENSGVSAARNFGLSMAIGEFIMFVDADDLVLPNAIDKLLAAAHKRHADFVYGGIKRFDSKNEWFMDAHIRNNVFYPGYKNLVDNPEVLFSIGVHGKLIQRKVLEGLAFPLKMKYTEDIVVMLKSFLNAKVIYTIPDVVYLYRERDLNTNSPSATQQKDTASFEYLTDAFKTILVCRDSIYKNSYLSEIAKINFLKKYYDRFFSYELWPVFIKTLSFDKKNNKNALKAALSFVNIHTEAEINALPAIRFYFINILIDRCFLIKNSSFTTYRQLLNSIIKKLSIKTQQVCAQPEYYGEKWEDSYFIATKNKLIAFIFFVHLKIKKNLYSTLKNNTKIFKKIIFPIFYLFPKDKNKIIFATVQPKPMRQNFTAVINEMKKQGIFKQKRIYKFLGLPSSLKTIFFRYYHLATAGTVFLEDYYKPIYGFKFSSKTNVVQLWHACGAFKRFSFDALGLKDSNSLEFEQNAHSMYTDIITSSEKLNPIYASALNASPMAVHSLGVPRTDLFFNNKQMSVIKKKILEDYPELSCTTNILYAPTFRGRTSLRRTFELKIDWKQVAQLPDNYKFIIKLHPVVKIITPEIPDYVQNKVLLLPSAEDVNHWMIFCDILITDYSSLIFEYSLLDKPIIFYPYDIKEYFDERGFYFDYNKYAYGKIVYNSQSLIKAILKAEIAKKKYNRKKQEFKNFFMDSCDGHSSSRIVQKFVQ